MNDSGISIVTRYATVVLLVCELFLLAFVLTNGEVKVVTRINLSSGCFWAGILGYFIFNVFIGV